MSQRPGLPTAGVSTVPSGAPQQPGQYVPLLPGTAIDLPLAPSRFLRITQTSASASSWKVADLRVYGAAASAQKETT